MSYTKFYRAGRITSAKGHCESGTWNGAGQAVVRDTYQVETKEYEGWYEVATGNLKQWSKCRIRDGYCEAGLSTLVYDVPKEDCQLTLLKKGLFDEYRGQLYKNQFQDKEIRLQSQADKDQFMKQIMREKTRESANLNTEDTPVAVMSTKLEDGMRFVRKDPVLRCGTTMYSTNYKGFYLSKAKVHDGGKAQIDVTQIKWDMYLNNKLSFLFNKQEEKIENIFIWI
jgi:hypothetical protein